MEIGQEAPEFSLQDQDGMIRALSDYRGQWVLLYFYPQDDTPGCTTEACQLRDSFPDFQGIGATVLGISKDSIASHRNFADKYGLPFSLLSDGKGSVVSVYGAARPEGGIRRTSFLVNPEGRVVKVYENVDPEVHADEVFRDLSALAA